VSAIAQTGAEGFLACFDALKDALPGDPVVRQKAAASFRRLGLPGGTSARRAEAWKYTSLRPVAETAFMTPVASGFTVDLAASTAEFTHFAANPDFGPLPRPDRDPMVALNTMLAEDGAILRVPAGTDAGIVRIESHGNGPNAFHLRHAIHLEAGATLVVVETATGMGSYLHNAVTEITVAEGAHLTHIRLQDESPGAFHFATIYAEVAEGATYDGFSLVLGGRIARTEIHAVLKGKNAVAHMNGAQLLTGNQHADFSSVVRHDAPNGTSRQTVKNVLAGRSRGVFQGRIEVARHAQKTDGYQMNQALLLSPDAEIDSKPELEIFADDVKCSHGATIGELDAEQLFYLRSRGVPDSEARAILVRAFLTEALDLVTNETIRATLEKSVDAWWERQAA
jgi:Fe-S cluster assembly protein SufD